MDIFEENCDTENNCTVSYFWKGLALFLLGVIIGLFVSPIKKVIFVCATIILLIILCWKWTREFI